MPAASVAIKSCNTSTGELFLNSACATPSIKSIKKAKVPTDRASARWV